MASIKTETELKKMKVNELRAELDQAGLDNKGASLDTSSQRRARADRQKQDAHLNKIVCYVLPLLAFAKQSSVASPETPTGPGGVAHSRWLSL